MLYTCFSVPYVLLISSHNVTQCAWCWWEEAASRFLLTSLHTGAYLTIGQDGTRIGGAGQKINREAITSM